MRSYLPANLPSNPSYRKVNPADAPIMIVSLTSEHVRQGPDVRLRVDGDGAKRISQVPGVGQVTVGGSSFPAVRVDVDPTQLASYGLYATGGAKCDLAPPELPNLARGRRSSWATGR